MRTLVLFSAVLIWAAPAGAVTRDHPARAFLAPAVHPGDHLNSIFAKTVAITGTGFAPIVTRVSGTASDTISSVADDRVSYAEDYQYDGFASGKDSVEVRDHGTVNCVDGTCNANDQTSAPLFNPLLWGSIPEKLALGMSWSATIDKPWEIGPAGSEDVRVTALDAGAGLVSLERHGHGTGASSDDQHQKQIAITVGGKPVKVTLVPGPSTWDGKATFIRGTTIADEIVLHRPVTLTADDGTVFHGEERVYTMFAQAS